MIKTLIKQISPPILHGILKKIHRKFNLESSIYDGLYKNVSDIPKIDGNPFEHNNWISYVTSRADARKNGVTNQDMHEMSLSLLASTLASSEDSDAANVIDFGGGVGMYWPAVKAQNLAEGARRFVVVDSPQNCAVGRQLFPDQGVEFYSDLAVAIAGNKKVQILNVASTLHYCLDFESVINLLCSANAKYIVISRHPAIDDGLPVAFTLQNVVSPLGYCGQHPVVLIGVATLAAKLAENGYSLIADYFSQADPGKYWRFSRSAVPTEYARIIDHALVFQRHD